MRHLLAPALLVLLLLVLVAPAGAQTTPAPQIASPVAGQSFDRAIGLTLGVRAAPGSSVVFGVSVSRLTDERGLLAGDDLYLVEDAAPFSGDAGLFVHAPGPASVLGRRPGTYYVQAKVTGPDGQAVPSDIGTFEITLPKSWTTRGKIPRSLGRQGRGSFLVNTRGLPAEVTAERFSALLTTSARRWGLRARGTTTRSPGKRDHRNVTGFSSEMPEGVLGLQVDFRERRLRVRNGQTSVRTVVVEQDLLLSDAVTWQQGPEHPTPSEFDLESTIVHELGHFAGNKQHRKRCQGSASPMIESIGAGEFWRTPFDRWIACASARTASTGGWAPVRRAGRIEHVVIDL
jgi:hypothetical protein